MKIGIDLGTTNSALAWIDPAEAEDTSFPPIHIFDIPQLVAPGRIEPRRTLPSFLFLEDGQPVGTYAREQGALVPTRLVHSAKSWLSNPDVDRTAKILPWDSPAKPAACSRPSKSPRASSPQSAKPGTRVKPLPLADQDVVLTVPASFDEEARELTVMAAERSRTSHASPCSKSPPPPSIPGSPTTSPDRANCFSTARSSWSATSAAAPATSPSSASRARATRSISPAPPSASICCSAATISISPSPGWPKPKSASSFPSASAADCAASVRRQGTPALRSASARASKSPCWAAARRSSAGALKTEITRAEALELTLEGFLPITPRGEMPKEEKRSLFRELGLPYVSDPAVSRHLAPSSKAPARPPTPSFSMAASSSRRSAARAWPMSWKTGTASVPKSSRIAISISPSPRGAAYYSYVRSTGSGVLVRGGLPRAYYIGIGDSSAVCLVPRGAEEGDTRRSGSRSVCSSSPTSPSRFASSARSPAPTTNRAKSSNSPRSVEEMHQHAPLEAVIRFGKKAVSGWFP